jgi:ligand-binding SRPBCC domain-containing protein
MPRFVASVVLSESVAPVFDFLRRPANLLRVTPPDLHLQLDDAPEELQLGSRLTLRTRRWGMKQRSVTEVVVFEPNVLFVEEQKEGAFRSWLYTHRFEATADGGTQVLDEIDYELPGGMLGLLLTPALVERELTTFFRYRNDNLAEILASR